MQASAPAIERQMREYYPAMLDSALLCGCTGR
jgi:hypothetical protein